MIELSCSKCNILLEELNLNCFKNLCTKEELNKELKQSLLKLHPDKKGNNELFIKFYDCIKYLLENYDCYYEKMTYCNESTHRKTKALDIKGKCIKFKGKSNVKVDQCEKKGYFYRKGYTRPIQCKFPHKLLKKALISNETDFMNNLNAIMKTEPMEQVGIFYSKMRLTLKNMDVYHSCYGKIVLTNKILPSEKEFKASFKPLVDYYKLREMSNLYCDEDCDFKSIQERLQIKLSHVYKIQKEKEEYGRDFMPFLMKENPNLSYEEIKSRIMTTKYTKSKIWKKDLNSFLKVFKKYPSILSSILTFDCNSKYLYADENFNRLDYTVKDLEMGVYRLDTNLMKYIYDRYSVGDKEIDWIKLIKVNWNFLYDTNIKDNDCGFIYSPKLYIYIH